MATSAPMFAAIAGGSRASQGGHRNRRMSMNGPAIYAPHAAATVGTGEASVTDSRPWLSTSHDEETPKRQRRMKQSREKYMRQTRLP